MSARVLAQIERLLFGLSREEEQHLIALLSKKVAQEPATDPLWLENGWQGKFPPDFDLDQALAEVRSEWWKELDWIVGVERGEIDPDECPCP